jgi:hypothetical protein
MEKISNADKLIIRASEHFDLELDQVQERHIQFIRDQDYAMNYGYQANPLLSYTVGEDGIVEFTESSREELVSQYDHRVNAKQIG